MLSTATASTTAARLFEHISTEATDASSSGTASASSSTGRPRPVVVGESAPTSSARWQFDNERIDAQDASSRAGVRELRMKTAIARAEGSSAGGVFGSAP